MIFSQLRKPKVVATIWLLVGRLTPLQTCGKNLAQFLPASGTPANLSISRLELLPPSLSLSYLRDLGFRVHSNPACFPLLSPTYRVLISRYVPFWSWVDKGFGRKVSAHPNICCKKTQPFFKICCFCHRSHVAHTALDLLFLPPPPE